MRRYAALGMLACLSACQPALKPDVRQYIEQQALANVEGMADSATSERFTVGEVSINDVGAVGVCGFVQTDRQPVLFVAMSKDVGGTMLFGPSPIVTSSYLEPMIESVRREHLEMLREAAGKAKCALRETRQ